MSRAAALVALALATRPAAATPTIAIDGCGFDAPAVAAALARERAGATTAVNATARVACTLDGDARLTVTTADGRIQRRDVDLRDVPPALVPRVLALVLAAVIADLEAPPTVALAPAPAPTPPPRATVAAPAVTALGPDLVASVGPGAIALASPRAPRASLLGDRRWTLGVAGRAQVRAYTASDTRLWGGAVTAVGGPWTLGVVAARGAVDHPLGQVTPWLVGVEVGATIACTDARPTTCVGARVEAGRLAVTATASDPMTTASDLAVVEVHGAVELSVSVRTLGVELGAALAVGAGSGLVARANAVEVAHLAGWTVGGTVEVRP